MLFVVDVESHQEVGLATIKAEAEGNTRALDIVPRDYLGDQVLTSLIMTDDVIFSLPLLSMTLIMSEKYHQELRTSTLSFNAPSRFLSIRIAGFYLLKSFIRSLNIFKEILCFFAIFQNSLRAMKRRQLLYYVS